MTIADKKADLAGPGISTYAEVEKILPSDYEDLQTPMARMMRSSVGPTRRNDMRKTPCVCVAKYDSAETIM